MQQFEPRFINFEFHDQTAAWAMYAYSTSYFVLFPLLGVAVLFALARREAIAPFRVMCLAIAADYMISLPLFLMFPVPERWAYPESHAILLSDQWSSALINAIRPMSALNNSFPSTHVSLTVIIIAVCWLFNVRLRNMVTALGLTVVLATFFLGIHWLADIIAGATVGLLSVGLAWRVTDTSERPLLGLVRAPSARRALRPANRLATRGI
jgi:membrane-associated phospholipid phosphatase